MKEQLRPGAQFICGGVPVQLLDLVSTDGDRQTWNCRLLFVEPRDGVFVFRKGTPYRALHGSLAFSA